MTVPTDGSPRSLFQQSTPPGPAGSRTSTTRSGCIPPLGGAGPDALRQLVEDVVQTTLEREFAQCIGVGPYERAAERQGARNGTRSRTFVTRVGRLQLEVPRDRASLFPPSVFARYQRHEQALVSTLAECYLQGVSTRKVRVGT